MGIFSHLFAHIASDAIKSAKKEDEKNKEWNDAYNMLQKKEMELCDYLASVGCKLPYIFDVNAIDNGSVAAEIRKMEKTKKDVEEYIALGGDIQVLFNLSQLERRIDVLRYLRKINQVHRQREFLDDNKYSVEDKIKAEEEALAKQAVFLRAEQEAKRETQIIKMVGSDINMLSGTDFEGVCQQLVENMGFKTEITKASRDGGIDLIAYNYQPLLSGKYIIQCKRYSGAVGEPIIRDLYGVIMSERANKGVLMTTGHFTSNAQAFAAEKPIELIDGTKFKELLLQYGLCSEDDLASPCIDNVDFDPQPFMGYYYSDYLAVKSNIDRIPDDIRSRCTLVEIIHDAVHSRLHLSQDDTYIINSHDIQAMVRLLRDNLKPMLQLDNSQSSNKRLKTIYYICLLIDGEAAVLAGDLVSATERFGKVLRDWSEFREDVLTFTCTVYSLFGVFKLAGCKEMIDKYYTKYKHYIDYCRKFYQESDDSSYHIEELEVIQNPYNATQYLLVSAEEIYDTCLDDWGNINVVSGRCRIDVNQEKNRLFYCTASRWKSENQETVLIENFDSVAKRQRDLVMHSAEMYL